MQLNPVRRLGLALMLAASCSMAVPAFAQDDKGAPEPTLKGPEVKDRNVPGAAPDFGMNTNRRFGDRVPPAVFRRALDVLTKEDAATELRATPEQRAKFKELVDGFEAAVRQYRREHAKEIQELQKAAGEARTDRRDRRNEPKDRDDSMKEMELSPEQQKARDEARAKLRELMAGAPKIEDIYTKVWTELSEPQREAVENELDHYRDEQAKRREDEYVRRQTNRAADRKATPAARAKAPAAADKDEMMQPMSDEKPAVRAEKSDPERPRVAARRERLLRLFAQLSPEEQDQLLERLEARSQDRRRPGAPARRAEPKPPADPDQVKVPKPEDDKQ